MCVGVCALKGGTTFNCNNSNTEEERGGVGDPSSASPYNIAEEEEQETTRP